MAFYGSVEVAIKAVNNFGVSMREAARAMVKVSILINGPYRHASIQFIKEFGKLPCGKSQRSRIKKKRKKVIMKWFEGRAVK